MNILFDGRACFRGMGGIGRHSLRLLSELIRIDPKNHYVCIFTHLGPPGPLELGRNAKAMVFEAGMIDERFDQFVLPDVLEAERIDLYHNPTFAVPVVGGRARYVSTIHDVVFRRHPELVEPNLRRHLDAATRRACRHADRIVTVSEFSKRELLDLYDAEPDRVTAIPNGVDAACLTPNPEALARMGLQPGTYVLYVGSIEPKKNIDLLLAAFRDVVPRSRRADIRLVLAGPRGSNAYPLEERVKELGLVERVVAPGYVPEETLEALYAGALIFVYPSLYEGFGFPPIEAMARGVPTIVSNASSLPEVVGDAAVLVDPGKGEDLTEAILNFAHDDMRRAEFARRGPERAARFTWRRCAEEHLRVYEMAMEHAADPARCV